MIGRLLCRIRLHRWVTKIGNYPGTDEWWRKEECWRCGAPYRGGRDDV